MVGGWVAYFAGVSGEVFDDFTPSDADTATSTAPPDTIGNEFLAFDLYEGDLALTVSDKSALDIGSSAFNAASTAGTPHSIGLLSLIDPTNLGTGILGVRFLDDHSNVTQIGEAIAISGVSLEIETIPEPSVFWMVALGLFLAGRRRREG